MSGTHRLFAGECTTEFEGTGPRARRQRGHVVCLVKPDDTVLVHDADGYQPVAWLTRPEALTVESDPVRVLARDGDQRLRVTVHDASARSSVPASAAGTPVGDCPGCGGVLVRTKGGVSCVDCDARYGLPGDASVLDESCDCGLPRIRAERGAAFEVCLDRDCESLDAAVREAFDRAWDCPDCGSDLRVIRRGGLLAGCDAYPDCETAFSMPRGVVAGTCDCGLPAFRTPSGGQRCLDATCGALDAT
jgi:DNA topoisomerase-1